MFVGRERELESLQRLYASNSFQFGVVYGRRRVGKTKLLRQFTTDKPDVIFFTAHETTLSENLDLLSRELAKATLDDQPASYPVFRTLTEAFDEVFRRAASKRLVFVIDEYPYLAQSDPGASSALQALIDANQEDSRLLLILCGSSMTFMEHQVLGKQSPLYGRRTAQLRIDPFTLFDAAKMLPEASPTKVIELYAITGGIPLYLAQLDGARSVEWNIAEKVFRQDAILYEEPRSYLQQETRSPSAYNSIVTAIAAGYVRPSEICDVTRLASSAVARYLDALIELKVVERVVPMVVRNKSRSSTVSATTCSGSGSSSSRATPAPLRRAWAQRSQSASCRRSSPPSWAQRLKRLPPMADARGRARQACAAPQRHRFMVGHQPEHQARRGD